MRRLIVWASPLIGVVLGLAGVLVFRQQPTVEADTTIISVPSVIAPASRPEARLKAHGARTESEVTVNK